MSNVVDELRQKREARLAKIGVLQQEADGLLVTIKILEEELSAQSAAQLAQEPARPHQRPRIPTSIVGKIESFLRSQGGTAHRREILHALESDGVHFQGKKESQRLQKMAAHLSNYKDRFQPATQPGNGYWKLKS